MTKILLHIFFIIII